MAVVRSNKMMMGNVVSRSKKTSTSATFTFWLCRDPLHRKGVAALHRSRPSAPEPRTSSEPALRLLASDAISTNLRRAISRGRGPALRHEAETEGTA